MTRILVVDDDDDIRGFVSLALADDGYEVTEAPNGAIALRLLRETHVDVILLDMRMPTMDGWEFSRIYRQTPGPRAPIIVMTAAQDAAKWADQINAEGYLGKPFDVDDLLDLVRRHRHP